MVGRSSQTNNEPLRHLATSQSSTKDQMKKNFLVILSLLILAAPFMRTRAQVNVDNAVVVADTILVWEGLTYTPPFYKGKALLTDGGDARILAFPPQELGSPFELSYTWKVDGVVSQEASGVGKSAFTYRSDIFGGSPLIVVEVSRGKERVSTGVIRIPLVEPKVALYPSLPLTGVLLGARASSVDGEEIALEAYPFFFSVVSKESASLLYRWKVNGFSANNPLGNAGRLLLRSEEGGSASVSLSVNNENRPLEAAEGALGITFNQ